MFTATINNHNVTIKPGSRVDDTHINKYVYSKLTEYSFTGKQVYVPELQRMSFPIKALYFLFNNGIYTVNRMAYVALKQALINMHGSEFNEVISKQYDVVTIDQDMAEGIKPRPHQVPAIKLVKKDTEYNARMLALQPGQGKGLLLHTPVLTPKGWVRNDSLKLGDFVIGKNGHPTEVTGVFPQGVKPAYRVEFIDGTTIETDDSHLWKVEHDDEWKIVSTGEMYTGGVTADDVPQYSIPVGETWYSDDVELKVSPFELGITLCAEDAPEGSRIPKEYLNAGVSQRFKLYTGMVGTVGEMDMDRINTLAQFPINSTKLAEDFCELARGLGMVVQCICEEVASPVGFVWEVSELIECVDSGKKQIISIEKIAYTETQCISVAAEDHLYIAEGYNVTHNTISTLCLAEQMKVPFVGILRPGYIGIWTKSMVEYTTAEPEDYLVIRGKKQLTDWIDTLDDDYKPYRYVLISNKTYDRWIKRTDLLSNKGNLAPDIVPTNIMERAGAGCLFVDETHLDFNFNYMLMLRTNVPKFLGLSGTFVSEDRFIIARQEDMYPSRTHQYDSLTVRRYIHVVNYSYSTTPGVVPVISHRGNKMYNHTAYEKWLTKNPTRLNNYFKMVVEVLEHDYIRHRISGSKAIVFFASVNMVVTFNDHLQKHHPEIVTIVYVAANEYEELLTPDIINSTLLKAGTGVDIKGLMLVINTVSVRSIQSNRQSIGRLRDEEEALGIAMRYVQIYNSQIRQHILYAKAREMQWLYIIASAVNISRINII